MLSASYSPNEEERKFGLMLAESFRTQLKEYAARYGTDITKVLRESAQQRIEGTLPVLGAISCGPLASAIESTRYHEVVPPYLNPRADLGDFLLEAEGDSMAPKIERGDLVMLRPNIEPGQGDICAVQIWETDDGAGECEGTLKKFYFDPKTGDVRLVPLNPLYPEIESPGNRVEVIGVYRGCIKRDM